MFTRLSVFKKYYKLIAMNLRKQQKLDADPNAMQQINFTENLSRAEDKTIFFTIEQAKETVSDIYIFYICITILFRFNKILIKKNSI